MSKNIEILEKYTAGEITTAQANEQLDGVHLEKDKNVLTPDEVKSSFVGATPDMATGFGLLDTGTGTFDKVAVKGGVLETDCGESKALYIIAGRTYAVEGNKLVDVKPVSKEDPGKDAWKSCAHNPRLARQNARIRIKELGMVCDVQHDENGDPMASTFVRWL